MAYSIIMRASTSTLSADDVAWHHLVTAYSQASYKATIHPNAETIEEADSLAARIPARILKKYHDVRDRNHEVNKACINLVRDGAVNRLLLLQEDAQPLGFHKLEQQKLLETIHAQGWPSAYRCTTAQMKAVACAPRGWPQAHETICRTAWENCVCFHCKI